MIISTWLATAGTSPPPTAPPAALVRVPADVAVFIFATSASDDCQGPDCDSTELAADSSGGGGGAWETSVLEDATTLLCM